MCCSPWGRKESDMTERLNNSETWKQPKYWSSNEWTGKIWHIPTMKYYSALKRKKILHYAITWINLEDIMLREISQSQKDKY